MLVDLVLSAVSALVFLAIAAAAVILSPRAPMAPPLGRMTASLFAYETFEILKNTVAVEPFVHLEHAAASLVAPTTAALILTFLGERRRLLWLVVVGATYFSVLSLLCIAATFYPPIRWFSEGAPWGMAMLAGLVPEFTYLGVLLWRHARRESARERARTQVLALALALGVGGAASDLVSIAGAQDAPRLAVFGLVGAALLLAALAFRLELLEGVRGIVLVNAVAIVALVVLLHLIVVSIAPGSLMLTATLGVAVTVAALATLRPVALALAEDRDRTKRLVTMGRFSAQMAHDLRNPLAAIRGAAQFLAEEKKRGGSLDEHAAFVELILEQTDRLGKVVSDYQRLGRAEAVRSVVDVVPLLRRLESGARVSSPGDAVTVEAPERLEHALDEDLVTQALENLIRNAREAGEEGPGAIEIVARKTGRILELAVRDHGAGMDARTKERALDEFFTTKATGSGLGLAFVSRVAEAHGGTVSIESTPGKGTTVTMHLPDA